MQVEKQPEMLVEKQPEAKETHEAKQPDELSQFKDPTDVNANDYYHYKKIAMAEEMEKKEKERDAEQKVKSDQSLSE